MYRHVAPKEPYGYTAKKIKQNIIKISVKMAWGELGPPPESAAVGWWQQLGGYGDTVNARLFPKPPPRYHTWIKTQSFLNNLNTTAIG